MIIVKEDKQLIVYDIDLSNELESTIGQCQLVLLLKVPMERIATEITTGFPYLMAHDRQLIHDYLESNYINYKNTHVDLSNQSPLAFLDQFIHSIQDDLKDLIEKRLPLELISVSIQVFADVYQSLVEVE